ncbi:MAG: nucleotide exchange factor GrpE [Synergistaceae bacterium]|nr:nucleotide exchange factor GrpE [Synergistaceae bacterium]
MPEMPEENFEVFMDDPAGEGSEAGNEAGERDSEMEELRNQLAAARADLYNYRQRAERERVKSRKLIAEDKTAEFLPVLDNLDRALNVPEDGAAKDVLIGVRMVRRQFLSVLENSDVTVIPAEGCSFDPLLHDAVETEFVEAPEQNGLVLLELMRGYRTPERVLRPAQVRVGKLRNQEE